VPSLEITEALARLDELTRRLRAECPWDRDQDERSIVPHTVEEAYELADAANAGDDAKLLEQQRQEVDLKQDVADHCRRKLIRRHPHVFGDVESEGRPQEAEPQHDARPDAPRSTLTSDEVLRNWDAIKAGEHGREPGIFGDVPENLPALLYARKLQRRAATAGRLPGAGDASPAEERGAAFDDIGERLFALVDEARRLRVDPELALRAAAHRFRDRTQSEHPGAR
jgi:uncharacterized protein YabN with tetrapyrrole methylase and pyrophosphatase domain